MFIREKRNKSGSVSIQVIEKVGRKNKLLKTIGCSSDAIVLKRLRQEGERYISSIKKQIFLPFDLDLSHTEWYNVVFDSIKSVKLLGPEMILGSIFDEIGFNKVETTELLRHLVISRLIYPYSKLKTVRYLEQYELRSYQVDTIYRYMDHLEHKLKEQIEQISYEHTKRILGGQTSVVFYDVTTIYFESEKEDELRKTGFSKEGKHRHPQILLGLLVSIDGYPLAYEIFEGNKYEGHTMLPVIESFKERFGLDRLIIIADSGLLTTANINELVSQKHEFILGARIKNESDGIKEQILSDQLKNNECKVIKKSKGLKLILSYSDKRAKKDAYNRKRGLERLENSLSKGKLNKNHINNRGYNKYLKMTGSVDISIDYEKFDKDQKWDGLKGYITNTQLNAKMLIKNYNELWKIEKAFRISKTDLKIRPIYHRIEKRIRAHICISFIAYKVYREMERQLKVKKAPFSINRSIELLKTIYGIEIKHPILNETKTMIHATNNEQILLLKFFNINHG